MNNSLKILATGDFHGDSRVAAALAEKAEKNDVDLVIICGDLAHAEGPTENLIGPFVKKGKKVLIVPGNHDDFSNISFLAERYSIKNIHGYSVKYKDVGIFGCGGSPNVGPTLPLTEEEMFYLLKRGHQKISYLKKKIMVTHMHPEGSLSEKLPHPVIKPSKAVRKAIDELNPDILFCCHVHEAEGIEEIIGKTRVINVGPKGKIVEI